MDDRCGTCHGMRRAADADARHGHRPPVDDRPCGTDEYDGRGRHEHDWRGVDEHDGRGVDEHDGRSLDEHR